MAKTVSVKLGDEDFDAVLSAVLSNQNYNRGDNEDDEMEFFQKFILAQFKSQITEARNRQRKIRNRAEDQELEKRLAAMNIEVSVD